MSFVQGDKSEDPKIHFKAGLKDFARLDKVRFINITGSIQYGILYCISFFIIGVILNATFPQYTKNISLWSLAGWILLQCIALIIVTFYVRKFIEAIPGILSFFPSFFNIRDLEQKGFIPYGVDEYKGDLASSLVLIGTQVNLFQKITYLTNELTKLYLRDI
jgi:hypothetical protein